MSSLVPYFFPDAEVRKTTTTRRWRRAMKVAVALLGLVLYLGALVLSVLIGATGGAQ